MCEKKKALGQFFTDPAIADYMSDLAFFDGAKTVLDPAVGRGVLIDAIQKKAKQDLAYTVYDLDQTMLAHIQEKASTDRHVQNLQALHADYLLSAQPKGPKYDIIICNPPYNRFQDIPLRKRYIQTFQTCYGLSISGFANLCVYFLVKSANELNPGGRCVYIMPFEFLNTGYGIAVKEYLIAQKLLKSIIKFDSHLRLFSDAVTTSCILVLENKPQDQVAFVTLRTLLQDDHQEKKILRTYDTLNPNEKWNQYFETATPTAHSSSDLPKDHPERLVPFGQYATVKRGIATGNNPYFALSSSQARALGLSEGVLIPCICKAPTVKPLIFTKASFDSLAGEDKKAWLFDGTKASTPADRKYLCHGETIGADKTYLTSHRTPWYKPEPQEPAPIWISVFNRNHIKVVRNEAGIKTFTTFHCLYLRTKKEEEINIFYCYLLTPFAQRLLYQNKREYGLGLEKFEPSDLKHAMILNLSRLSAEQRAEILRIYDRLRPEGDHLAEIQQLDEIFTMASK